MSLVRQQIGGQPEPRRLFGGSFTAICPLLPQQAWLEGSLLIVERGGKVSQCDLVAAARIKVRSVPPLINLSCEVLSAYPEPTSIPTRLVLAGPDWYTLTAQQGRQLAQIIGSRTHDKKAADKVVRYLRDLAAREAFRTQPIDWSFRTDPEGLRKRQGG
jgi:hypothetical protein